MQRDRMGSNSSTGSGELRLDRLLPDFSFIRIAMDHVTVAEDSPFLTNLQQRGSIFGYTLKYSFPCPDGVSSSLRARVILRASSFSSNAIFFRHKRVNLVKLNTDVIPFWSEASLVLDLEVQLNAQGKYSTRPLARCTVPLSDLLLPPFAIARDYDFRGTHFAGSALIRIDLGSQQRTLMARLERWRGEAGGVRGAPLGAASADTTFTVPPGRHTRSRSGSRCRSHSSLEGQENSNNNGLQQQGRGRLHSRAGSTASDDDDDVFYDEPRRPEPQPQPRTMGRGMSPLRVRNASLSSLNGGGQRTHEEQLYSRPLPAVRRSSASSLPRASPVALVGRHALRIRLVVHAAAGLPMTRDHRGLLVPPSALISVRGRDGELRSPVQSPSRSPRFSWSCTFDVSAERRNVVIKVLHRDDEGNDVPLGFVSLALPMATVREADYELVELSGGGGGTMGGEASMIRLSVESCASSRPPSKLADDDGFCAPVPVAPAPERGAYDSTSSSLLDDCYATRAGAPDGRPRSSSRLSAASSMTLPGGGGAGGGRGSSGAYRSGSRPRPRSRSPPDILILETREEIENRLRKNMSELDILMSRLDRR